MMKSLDKNGAPDAIRTRDPLIPRQTTVDFTHP